MAGQNQQMTSILPSNRTTWSAMTYVHNLILKDQRIVVTTVLRQEMKETLHIGHSGIGRCKRRARDTLYLSGINAHLEDYVASCTTSIVFRNQQQKEKLIPHNIPSEVWSKVGTDLFTLRNKDYLIIADYNSKFFEISELPNTLAPRTFTWRIRCLCDVTLSAYPHRAGLKNMPGHGGIRTYDRISHTRTDLTA